MEGSDDKKQLKVTCETAGKPQNSKVEEAELEMKLSNVNGYESPNFGCSCKKACFKMDQADQIGRIVQGHVYSKDWQS